MEKDVTHRYFKIYQKQYICSTQKEKAMKNLFAIFTVFIYSTIAFSINYNTTFNIKSISVNEGLSQFDATRIIQDQYGFLWVSTYDGLNRYNGNDFIQYRHDPYNKNSINGNRILNIYIDSKKNFWVISETNKIDRFDYKTEQFEHYDFEPLKYAIVTAFYEDKLNNYWIGTTNGLYKASLKENQFQVDGIYLNSTTPSFENFIQCITESEKNGILVGTGLGGVLLSYRGQQIYSPSKFQSNVQINSFFKDKNNTIWICHNKGLSYIKDQQIQQLSQIKNNAIQSVLNFLLIDIKAMAAIDDKNCIVVAGHNLYHLHIPTLTISNFQLNDYSFFNSNIVKSVFVDHTKNIWISSGQKGIAKIDLYQKPQIIFGKEETKSMFVKSVFKDSRDRVWVGTNLNGMYYYDTDGIIHSLPITDINSQISYISPSMAEDRYGNIWFCANSEVYLFNYEEQKVRALKSLNPVFSKFRQAFSLTIDKFNTLWIGNTSGLLRVKLDNLNEPAKFISIGNLSDMISSEQISRMLYDSIHNVVWACTKDNGVTMLNLDKQGEVTKIRRLVHSDNKNSLSSDHVWSILLTSDSTVLFGTDSGINECRIINNKVYINPITNLHFIKNAKIVSLAQDLSGVIWMGTSQFLISYHPKTKVIKKYTSANGLYSSALQEGIFVDKKGVVYISTTNGLNWIDTTPQPEMPYLSNVQIVDFKIFGKSIKTDSKLNKHIKTTLYKTSKISLKHNENNFTIDFLSTHYNDINGNAYTYKLEGYDKDSIVVDGNNKSVTYNNLSPGRYTFWVKSSNNDNIWGGKKRYLTVEVKPAPWLTIWAFFAYLLIIIGVLYFVYVYLNKETKLKQKLVIKELENEHQNEINNVRLRFHTNIAHDIRTPLTLIAGPLDDIKLNPIITANHFLNDRIGIIDKNVTRLLYLVNQFLDFRRLINDGSQLQLAQHPVLSVFNDIKKSFKGIAQTKNIHFEFILDVVDKELIFDVDKLTKIVYNLISNAFKYTESGGDILVFVEQTNNNIVIKVQDTGSGIPTEALPHILDRFYQSEGQSASSGTGIGLALVKQLVEVCKGQIEVQSEIGRGSEFKVTIPCEIPNETATFDVVEVAETLEENLKTTRKPIILVVEDDDDLRAYLVKCFKEKFIVHQAIDGQDGFDKTLRFTPDIILTDIMMPKVDGLGLIHLIRNDYRTSHIPIIVITAKSTIEDEIKALEAGAEGFITKPFSTKSLLLKVNNFIRNLSANKAENKETDEVKIMDREQQFLNKMNKVILENLENPIFSIDFICEKLSISRMQLHRKIVTLLGKSTSEYIREIKLDEAKKYFDKGEKDIETVMLKIGVNSTFHFNKNFKLRFGVSIQEYIKSLSKTVE